MRVTVIFQVLKLSLVLTLSACSKPADWFWPENAAPWESVDAYYYPDRNNLSIDSRAYDLKTIDECRDWVSMTAEKYNDANLDRGDYECGVGFIESFGSGRVYRITTR